MELRRPNLLFVFPDQWRASALGFRGQDPVLTPHLDAFAAQSRVLTDCISNFPVCSPYRAMLMTGKYPHSNGVLGNCHSARPESFLRAEENCLSDVLHESGYVCGYIGKWHLEHPRPPYLPSENGQVSGRGDGLTWDEWTPPARRHGFTFWHSYGAYDDHLRPRYWTNGAAREEPIGVNEWSPRHETDVAIEFLRTQAAKREKQPFALVVSMNPPHPPFPKVPPEYLDLYAYKTAEELLLRPNVAPATDAAGRLAREQIKRYFAACTGVDEQFGRLLAALKENGLEDDTIVVFTSDHGEMMGSHGLMGKPFAYEEALNVPFIVRWPGKIAPGTDDLLLGAPDIMPTLLGMMELGERIPRSVEGIDYSGALQGKSGARPDSALYLRTSPETPEFGERGVRTHRHTFWIERSKDGEKRFLFDNETDPFQQQNCAETEPVLARQLGQTLHGWLEKTRDPWLSHE